MIYLILFISNWIKIHHTNAIFFFTFVPPPFSTNAVIIKCQPRKYSLACPVFFLFFSLLISITFLSTFPNEINRNNETFPMKIDIIAFDCKFWKTITIKWTLQIDYKQSKSFFFYLPLSNFSVCCGPPTYIYTQFKCIRLGRFRSFRIFFRIVQFSLN